MSIDIVDKLTLLLYCFIDKGKINEFVNVGQWWSIWSIDKLVACKPTEIRHFYKKVSLSTMSMVNIKKHFVNGECQWRPLTTIDKQGGIVNTWRTQKNIVLLALNVLVVQRATPKSTPGGTLCGAGAYFFRNHCLKPPIPNYLLVEVGDYDKSVLKILSQGINSHISWRG
jgi:hypothetical protein